MGAELYATSPAAKQVFDTADEALGFSLSTLCFQGPEETLLKTINAQPAIVTTSLAFLAAFQEALSSDGASSWSTPLRPNFTAGHSVGEWTALVASGVLPLPEAIRLVRERGRLMDQEERQCPGSMAAIIVLDNEILQEICQEATRQALAELSEPPTHPGQGQVIIANYNAPGQTVISGEKRALELACTMAQARGAKKVIPLTVSGAFHSPVMQPAVQSMAQTLAPISFQNPMIPVISNISATPITSGDAFREELAQQLAAPVQWTSTTHYLAQAGVTTFIEIGPGKAITSMVKRTVDNATILNVGKVTEIRKVASLMREMGIVKSV